MEIYCFINFNMNIYNMKNKLYQKKELYFSYFILILYAKKNNKIISKKYFNNIYRLY
jgi:hypothetical protein